MSNDETDRDSDEMYQQLTNDRTKAARAERTVGDADRVDDARTVIRYVGEDRGVDQFQVAFTKTDGFPLGKTCRSIQPENHIRDWMEKNDAELIDAREDELFEPTASEDSVAVALETDGGMTEQEIRDLPEYEGISVRQVAVRDGDDITTAWRAEHDDLDRPTGADTAAEAVDILIEKLEEER